jgi:hypothetical protein
MVRAVRAHSLPLLVCVVSIFLLGSHAHAELSPADTAALKARGIHSEILTEKDKQILNIGEFKEFVQQLKTRPPCNRNPTGNLAYRTRNTGAQVCAGMSRKWQSIGCHPNNNTAIFPTHSHGFAAHVDLLRRFCATQGRCTINRLFGDNGRNSYFTDSNKAPYLNFVTRNSGIPLNLVFNPNDAGVMGRIAASSACYEGGGFAWTAAEIEAGLRMAFGGPPVSIPSNVGELLNESLAGPINNTGSPFNSLQHPNSFSTPTQQLSQQPFNNPQQPAGASSPNPNTTTPFNPGFDPASPFQQTPFAAGAGLGSAADLEDIGGVASISCTSQKVSWSCDAPATISRMVTTPTDSKFKTNGALIGAIKVNPTKKTTYTIQCLRTQRIIDEASCAVSAKGNLTGFEATSVNENAGSAMILSLSAEPTIVTRGKRTTIVWGSIGATDCTVHGEGVAGNGVEGEEKSDPLLQRGAVTYTLQCQDESGDVEEQQVNVQVR